MVERPIKKSDRQPNASTDNNAEKLDSVPPVESNPKTLKRINDISSSRGKKASLGDESKQQVHNPALARGPKPVKPPAIVKTEPETESQPISEENPND